MVVTKMETEVMEKFLAASHLRWLTYEERTGRYRRGIDDFTVWVLNTEDAKTLVYQQYEYLRGRDEEYIPFLRGELGYNEDDRSADEKYFDKYFDRFQSNYEDAKKRGYFTRGK